MLISKSPIALKSRASAITLTALTTLVSSLMACASLCGCARYEEGIAKRTIVFAIRDIKGYKPIDMEAIEEKQIAARKVPQGAAESVRELVGLTAIFDIPQGSLISWRAIDRSKNKIMGTVVRAAKVIPIGHEVTNQDILEDSMPAISIPQDSARHSAEVLGRKALSPIKGTEIISLQKIDKTAATDQSTSNGTILRAKKDLPAGTQLTAADVSEEQLLVADIPQDALSSIVSLEKRTLNWDIKEHDVLCQHFFSSK